MATTRPKRRGKLAFAGLLAVVLALLAFLEWNLDGGARINALLRQTSSADADGYLSDYEARLSRAPLPTEAVGPAQTATPAQPTGENEMFTAPAKPQKPQPAR